MVKVTSPIATTPDSQAATVKTEEPDDNNASLAHNDNPNSTNNEDSDRSDDAQRTINKTTVANENAGGIHSDSNLTTCTNEGDFCSSPSR